MVDFPRLDRQVTPDLAPRTHQSHVQPSQAGAMVAKGAGARAQSLQRTADLLQGASDQSLHDANRLFHQEERRQEVERLRVEAKRKAHVRALAAQTHADLDLLPVDIQRDASVNILDRSRVYQERAQKLVDERSAQLDELGREEYTAAVLPQLITQTRKIDLDSFKEHSATDRKAMDFELVVAKDQFLASNDEAVRAAVSHRVTTAVQSRIDSRVISQAEGAAILTEFSKALQQAELDVHLAKDPQKFEEHTQSLLRGEGGIPGLPVPPQHLLSKYADKATDAVNSAYNTKIARENFNNRERDQKDQEQVTHWYAEMGKTNTPDGVDALARAITEYVEKDRHGAAFHNEAQSLLGSLKSFKVKLLEPKPMREDATELMPLLAATYGPTMTVTPAMINAYLPRMKKETAIAVWNTYRSRMDGDNFMNQPGWDMAEDAVKIQVRGVDSFFSQLDEETKAKKNIRYQEAIKVLHDKFQAVAGPTGTDTKAVSQHWQRISREVIDQFAVDQPTMTQTDLPKLVYPDVNAIGDAMHQRKITPEEGAYHLNLLERHEQAQPGATSPAPTATKPTAQKKGAQGGAAGAVSNLWNSITGGNKERQ